MIYEVIPGLVSRRVTSRKEHLCEFLDQDKRDSRLLIRDREAVRSSVTRTKYRNLFGVGLRLSYRDQTVRVTVETR
jgi:hypothetical protein